ncbi:MAG: carboxypeptidase-like regulatory domain-containing protein [Bacteroidota bacterium]
MSVRIKGTNIGTSSDVNGVFELKNVDENATLVFSGVNVEPYEIKVNGKTDWTINV